MSYRQDLKFNVLVAALGVWLILGSLGIGWVDSTFYALAFALLALTTTLALTNTFRFAGWAAAAWSSILFVAVQVIVYGVTPRVLPPIIVCIVAVWVAAVFGTLANRQAAQVVRQLEQHRQLIDELRAYDPDTNLLRFPYALQTLKSEIRRSQRYKRETCLLFLQVAEPEEWARSGGADKKATYLQLADLLRASLRTVDVPFCNATKLGAILPETDPAGARIVCERLAESVAHKARLAAHIGVAHFPSDGVTEDELVRGAEAALNVSVTTGQPVVFYVQLRHAARSAPETTAARQVELGPAPGEAAVAAPAPAVPPSPDVQLGIRGLKEVADTLRIEKALRDYLGVSNVHPLRFAEGMLIFRLEHPPRELAQKLPELVALPVRQVTSGDGWIEVRLEESSTNLVHPPSTGSGLG